jgi:hypothetical protein
MQQSNSITAVSLWEAAIAFPGGESDFPDQAWDEGVMPSAAHWPGIRTGHGTKHPNPYGPFIKGP